MQKRKRVVSKSEYVAYLAQKTTLASGSILFWIGGILFGILTIICGAFACVFYPSSLYENCLTGVFLWGIVSSLLIVAGVVAGKAVKQIEPVLPSTRQNVEQLLVEETLVRASTEPSQEQEKVLLRASVYSQATSAEQLLRPSDTPD